jgi:hypothetical protein
MTAAGSAALTQVTATAQWLCYSKPLTQLNQTAAQSIPNITATAVQWVKITDRDGGFTSATTYTAESPGYYQLAASVAYAANSAGVRQAWFTVTTGAANPAGPGVTTSFALASVPAPSGVPAAVAPKSLVAARVYIGDYFQVMAFQSSGAALLTSVSPAGSWWTISMVSA